MPTKNGTQKYVERVSECMAELGHDVTIYCANEHFDKKEYARKKIKLFFCENFLGKVFGKTLNTFFASVHAILEHYDVVHIQSKKDFYLKKIFAKLSPETKVVASFDLLCELKSKPNVTVKISKAVDEIIKYQLRSKRYVLLASNLVKESGAHYAIEAFKSLEDTASIPNNFKLVLLEKGISDEQYLNYLRTITSGRSNIILINSSASKLCKQLFSHAYLFIQSSEVLSETSEALLSAMSHGVAPIVSNTKENLEVTKDVGFKFEAKSASSLREQLAYLLNRNEEVERAGKLARVEIEKAHSWETITQKSFASNNN